MSLFLLRHGEINPGPERRFVGQTDLPLTDKGVHQAKWWGRRLKDTGVGAIVASDLVRCRMTAEIIAKATGLPLQLMAQLREIDLGDWENRTMESVRKNEPERWAARGNDLAGFRPPGGESFADLADRVVPVFSQIAEQDGSRLIVTHAGVIRVLLCRILGLPLDRLFRFDLNYGSLSIIIRSQGTLKLSAFNRLADG